MTPPVKTKTARVKKWISIEFVMQKQKNDEQ